MKSSPLSESSTSIIVIDDSHSSPTSDTSSLGSIEEPKVSQTQSCSLRRQRVTTTLMNIGPSPKKRRLSNHTSKPPRQSSGTPELKPSAKLSTSTSSSSSPVVEPAPAPKARRKCELCTSNEGPMVPALDHEDWFVHSLCAAVHPGNLSIALQESSTNLTSGQILYWLGIRRIRLVFWSMALTLSSPNAGLWWANFPLS